LSDGEGIPSVSKKNNSSHQTKTILLTNAVQQW